MPKLKPDELRSRLRFDYDIIARFDSPLVHIEAFKGLADLRRRKNPIVKAEDGHRACAYSVEYRIRSLVGEDTYHDRFQVSIDLLSGGNYPYSPPACFVTSEPIPWSPHFLPDKGTICLGELWSLSGGRMTLGHLIIHIARLLIFDEEDRRPSYEGWNGAAVKYWRSVLHRQPITKDLSYPVLPVDITHALEPSQKCLFRPATAAGFASAQPLFRAARR